MPKVILISLLILFTAANSAARLSPPDGEKFFPADPERAIKNRYIVVLEPGGSGVGSRAENLTRTFGGKPLRIWETAIEAFLAAMTENQARGISNSPWVEGVYQDSKLPSEDVLSNLPFCFPSAPNGCSPPGDWDVDTRSFTGFPQSIECSDPDPAASGCRDNWGLDRLDGFSVVRDGDYHSSARGTGVDVYIIDTGLFEDHTDFGGRVVEPYRNSTFDESGCDDCAPFCFPPCGTDIHDYWGHGTHVAGILGGALTGVAKEVSMHPVRILNRNCGPEIITSDLCDAFDWVEKVHTESMPTAVVNFSANSPGYASDMEFEPLRMAVRDLAARDNLLLIQSAGNGSADACAWGFGDEVSFPVGSAEFEATSRILIVGGSDENDGRWRCDGPPDSNCDSERNSGSNLGSCVDVWAPAAHIVSTYPADGGPDSPQAVCRSSGTSMAAAFVTGVAALILDDQPDLSASELREALLGSARSGLLEDQSSSPNFIGAGSPDMLIHFNELQLFEDGFESGDLKPWTLSSQ